jgi:hypothetical protein
MNQIEGFSTTSSPVSVGIYQVSESIVLSGSRWVTGRMSWKWAKSDERQHTRGRFDFLPLLRRVTVSFSGSLTPSVAARLDSSYPEPGTVT